MPETNIPAITGVYLKISRRTPLRDVKVVEPVKLSAIKAVTGDHSRITARALPVCTQ